CEVAVGERSWACSDQRFGRAYWRGEQHPGTGRVMPAPVGKVSSSAVQMRSIDVTISAGSQEVTAFRAIKRFQPAAMLGPTLALLRSAQPLHVDLAHCEDCLACLSSLLQLLDELEQLQISYAVELSDQLLETGDLPPVWLRRSGTKADIAAALEIE